MNSQLSIQVLFLCLRYCLATGLMLISSWGFANKPISAIQIDQLLDEAWEYRSENLDSMNRCLTQALQFSEEIHYSKGKGKALSFMGFRSFVMGKYDLAIEFFEKADPIMRGIKDTENLSQNENFSGLTYWSKGELDKALIHQLAFLNLGVQLNDQNKIADAYLNIGAIYKNCNEFHLAQEYLKKGLIAQYAIENFEGVGYCLHHLAGIHFSLKNHSESYEYFQKAITAWEKTEDQRGLGYSYAELGKLVLETNKDSSLFILEKAVELVKVFDQGGVYAGTLHNLGCYYFNQNELAKAEPLFEKSLKIATQHNAHHIIADNASKLALIHKDRNNLKLANQYLQLQLTYKDSLNAKNQKDIRDWLIAKNELEQERLENDYLKKRETANQEVLKNQKIILVCLFFILFSVLVFSLFLYKNRQKEKRINNHLKALNETIQEKNEAIENQSAQLIAINRELKDFTAVASHDMKAPLRTILTMGNILKEDYIKEEEPREYINFIIEAGNRMSNLLKSLLQYAQSGGKAIANEIVNLNDIVAIVQRNLMVKIQESNAKITLENDLPKVYVSKEPLIQLFQNLIGNGIKFNPKGQQPKIKITSKNMGDFVQVFITDNGIGIPEKHMDSIFQPFKRLHTRQEYEGSGLGLATCKKIVESFGGNIKVKSEMGQGTTFIINLPLRKEV